MTIRSALNRQASERSAFFWRAIQPRGKPVASRVVVERDDLVDQRLDQRRVVAVVLDRRDGMRLALADGEAVGAIVRLGPPAVEDREVEAPLSRAFSPEVPLASWGRRGLFSQTSTPWTSWRATFMS